MWKWQNVQNVSYKLFIKVWKWQNDKKCTYVTNVWNCQNDENVPTNSYKKCVNDTMMKILRTNSHVSVENDKTVKMLAYNFTITLMVLVLVRSIAAPNIKLNDEGKSKIFYFDV